MKTPIHITNQTVKPTGSRTTRTVVCVLACWLCLAFDAVAGPPPTISSQPTNLTVQVGSPATFAVQASGNGFALTYQWYFQAAPIATATNNTYIVTNAQPANAGTFYVAVNNGNGTVNSSNAVLTVNAPITLDNASSATTNAGTLTWSHTVGSGADRILLVEVAVNNTTVASVTYGGVPLTFVGSNNGFQDVEMWRLYSPPTGTANVVVTATKNSTMVAGATSYLYVNQITPLGTAVSAGDKDQPPTPSATLASATNELVIAVAGVHSGTTSTVGSGQSQVWQRAISMGPTGIWGATSTKPGAASVTMSWSVNTSDGAGEWNEVAVAIKPFSAPPPPPIVWNGGGANNNWSTGANWVSNSAPANNGTANILLAGSTRLAPNVDASWNILGLGFSNNAGAFTMGGNALTVQGLGINNNSANIETISNKMTLGNSATFSSTAGPLILSGNLTNAGYLLTVDGTGNVIMSGVINGLGGLTKNGSGMLTLSGSNTFTGNLSVNAGTLALGSSNRLADSVNVIFFGGTFATAGFNETVGTLTLNSSSTIDLGSGVSVIHFTNSSGAAWSAGTTLVISNWSGSVSGGGTDQLYFGNGTNGLTPVQLAQINFVDSFGVRPARLLSTGEVVPGITADIVATVSGATNIYATSNLTYTITVTNAGPYPATNVVVSDNYPTNSTFVSASSGGTNINGIVNWNIPVLANAATTNFTVTVTAPLTGTLTNIASSTAATPDSNVVNNNGSAAAAQVFTTIIPLADIVTTQTGPTSVDPFTSITYTVTVSNQGPSTASAVVVSDTLASKFNFISASAGGTYLAGVVTWPAIGGLASGAATNFTVTVAAPNKGTLTNTASSTSVTADPNTSNNDGSAAAAQVVTAVTSLKVANTSSAGSVTTLNWSHTISAGSARILIVGVSINSPTANITAATFANFFPLTLIGQTNGSQTKVAMYYLINPPVGTYPISINLNTATGIVGGAASFNGADQVNPIAAFAGNIGSGSVASVTVASTLGGVVVDTVAPQSPHQAVAPGAGQTVAWNQSSPSYAGAGSTTPGTPSVAPSWSLNGNPPWTMGAVAINPAQILADITLKATGPASVLATSNLTYTLTVTNLGNDPATNVVVSDVLPAGAVFVSASSGGTNNAGTINWPTLTSFVSGATTNYTVTITAPSSGTMTNIAYTTASTADPDPSNNNGTGSNNQVITTVTPLADVATTVTGPTAVSAASNYSYSIWVTNLGPSTAGNILVSNTLPDTSVFVSASAGGSVNGGVVTWPVLASLANGAGTNYAVTVTAPGGGSVTNRVSSSADTLDPNPANNNGTAAASQVVTQVYPRPLLSGIFIPGLGFQLQFTNQPNTAVSIGASTNLADWQILITTNTSSSLIDFIDQDASVYPRRFYRTMQGP